MTADALIDEAERAGVRLWRDGGRLRYAGRPDAVRPLLPRLAASKADLLATLPDRIVTAAPTAQDARQRIATACVRLSLPADLIGRQFDSCRYSPDNLTEMSGWDDPTIEAHARLLLIEASERTQRSNGVGLSS